MDATDRLYKSPKLLERMQGQDSVQEGTSLKGMLWAYLETMESVTTVCFSKTSPFAGKIALWGTLEIA